MRIERELRTCTILSAKRSKLYLHRWSRYISGLCRSRQPIPVPRLGNVVGKRERYELRGVLARAIAGGENDVLLAVMKVRHR